MVAQRDVLHRAGNTVPQDILCQVHMVPHHVHGLGTQLPRVFQDFHRNADFPQVVQHGPAHDVIYRILLPAQKDGQFGADD